MSVYFIVNASNSEVGAILSQRSAHNQKLHPCTFFSRSLSPTEKNHVVGNREQLAIKLALEWSEWLEGAEHPFIVWTDYGLLIVSDVCCSAGSVQRVYQRFSLKPGKQGKRGHNEMISLKELQSKLKQWKLSSLHHIALMFPALHLKSHTSSFIHSVCFHWVFIHTPTFIPQTRKKKNFFVMFCLSF